jgi:CubicO group peptidase (beta-lactamase class C family)
VNPQPIPESPPSEPALADATADQQRRFAHAFGLIEEAISRRIFPGAVLAVASRGQLVAWQPFGRFTYEPDSPEVRRETIWDLASLTKPIATVSMAMLLFERGQLPLDAPVVQFLPRFASWSSDDAAGAPHPPAAGEYGEVAGCAIEASQPAWRQAVTIAMLLAHSSGLPAHRKLYLQALGREAIQLAASRLLLEAQPGIRVAYSDIGFIILGELLESIGREPLDLFCQREIFSPLSLRMSFTPHPSVRMNIPPTANDLDYRLRVIQGEVNDENAGAMGGQAPHAGLFSDALSVARFAECLLRGGSPLFRPATVALFTARQTALLAGSAALPVAPVPAGTSRTLGWDTPSPPSQSGTLFSARSFGHLGYTGTSLWCDPERQLSVTLLTNRTWPDSSNQNIKLLRPLLHDAVLRTLDED